MVDGSSFTTVTIDVPVYLNYLFSRFLSKGGAAVKGQVQHIKQVIEGGVGAFTGAKNCPKPVAIVVCVGLGARFLGGIEDKDMYPIRGQTVLVQAPLGEGDAMLSPSQRCRLIRDPSSKRRCDHWRHTFGG